LKADLYLLTNDGTAADKVALSFGVPSDKIRFLKNGINKEWGISCYDETLKKEIAPNKEFVLLSVSRLVNWKQVDLIIKALPDLIRLNNNIKLIIVGDGPDRVKLEKLCIQLQISEYVIFTGALPQKTIKDYMAISDIFISMNALSSLSNPVFEAMICGKTAIALNRGTTKELIRNEENGILVEEEQIDELPLIMNNILQNDIMRKRIGDSAKKYMLEQWPTWEERVSQEISIIESLF
jgi:glycosyltransferase involved in cell wall biosynthesis